MKAGSFALFPYFFRLYPWQSLFVIGALLCAGVAEMVGVGALLPLIMTVLEQGSSEQNVMQSFVSEMFSFFNMTPDLPVLLLTIVSMVCIKAVIIFFAMRYAGYISADIARDFQLRLIRALMGAKWTYFSSLSSGCVANAIASESQRAGGSYMLSGKFMTSAMQALIYLVFACTILWKLSLLAIFLGGLLAFMVKGIMRMARRSGQDLSLRMDVLMGRLNDSLSAVKPLKAMALEDRFCVQLEKETEHVLKARKGQYLSALLIQVIYEPALTICLAIGLYYVLTFSSVPIPEVLLLAFLFHRLMGYVSLSQSHYQNIAQNESAVWSLEKQIKDAELFSEEKSIGTIEAAFAKSISIKDISVRYGDDAPFVLKNFTAEIYAKKLTLFFGASGLGKTTMMDVILGLIPVCNGEVLIDGDALEKIDLRKWREDCGYVPQDSFLFHDTLRENITLGDKSFSDDDVWEALERSFAADFVREMSDGLDSIAGERGGKLSGGQRQRIILARALIRKPRYLVLDEPTSALDKENEQAVFKALKEISEEMSVIIISHDPSLKNIADDIIAFDQKQ